MKALIIKVFKKKRTLLWMLAQSEKVKLQLILLIILSIGTTLCGVILVISSKTVIDTATSADNSGLLSKCLIMALIIVINVGLQSLTNVMNTRTTVRFEAYLKEKLFEKILGKEWIGAIKFHSGDLMTRFTSDINIVSNGITGIIPVIFALFTQLIAAFYVLLVLDSTFAFIALILGPTVILFGRYYSKKSKRYHTLCQESDSEARSFLQEALQSLILIKTFSTEGKIVGSYKNALDNNIKIQIRRNSFSVLAGMGLSLSYWLGYIFAIGWGSYRLSMGYISFGTMTAFIQLIGQVQLPFMGLAKTFPQIFSVIASSERLIEIENIPDETSNEKLDETEIVEVEKLVIDGVGFSYNDENILEDINIEFNQGEFIILAGPSGEGKTTLLRMLLGLLTPASGRLYLLGKKGEQIKIDSSTRRYFTYVPQGNLILSGTIEENIKYGNSDASYDAVVECAKAACIYDFIMEQPQQFKTLIGERGIGLSEGQAQRIAIARALLHSAPILLFDEATSALDQSLEKDVLENLKDYAKEKILIFVSHRKSINRICERAIILENGSFKENCA